MEFRGWSTKVLDATWPVSESANGLQAALQRICTEASAAIEAGYEFIVLSDRNQGARSFPSCCCPASAFFLVHMEPSIP